MRGRAQVGKRLQEIARTARLKGFRPGKIPAKVVEQRWGTQVREEVLGELIRTSFDEAVRQEHVQPAGNPDIKEADVKNEDGQLSYTATFEVVPEFGEIDVTQLEFDRVTATVTLSPQQGATKEVAVPVQLLAPKDYTSRFVVEFSQPQVVLALHGPASLLGGLQAESEMTAYVALRPTIELGVPVEVPVGVMGPAWATYDPVTIRVTVNLAPARPGPASPTGAAGSP